MTRCPNEPSRARAAQQLRRPRSPPAKRVGATRRRRAAARIVRSRSPTPCSVDASPRSESSTECPPRRTLERVASGGGQAHRRPGGVQLAARLPAAPRRSRRRRSGRRRGRRPRARAPRRAAGRAARAPAARGRRRAREPPSTPPPATHDAASGAPTPSERQRRRRTGPAPRRRLGGSQLTSMRARTRASSARQLGPEREPEQEARDHVGDVERQRRAGDREERRRACGSRRASTCTRSSPPWPRAPRARRRAPVPTRPRRRRLSAPSAAPARPTHAPGGHLPGRVRALAEHDVRGEHPERADGEAGQRAERVADDERHRGDRLDVGQRHEGVAAERGERPRACATTATMRAEGRAALVGQPAERRARARRSANEASGQLTARSREALACRGGARGAATAVALARRRRAAAPRPARAAARRRRRRGCGRSRWRSTSRRRAARAAGPSAITRPSASSTARSAQAAANSGSWVATITAWPARARRRSSAASSALACAVHAARGLVQREHGRRVAELRRAAPAPVTIASASRWRSPPERSRGLRSARPRQPDRRERLRRGLLADALVDEVVAGVLQQQRHPAGALDAPARGLQQPGGVAQQRRLAGAVAAHQRDALAGLDARGRRRAGSPGRRAARARRRACASARRGLAARRRARARRRAPARRRPRASGAVGLASGSSPCARSVARAWRTPAGARMRGRRARTASRPGVCSAGARSRGPREERRGIAVAGDRARRSSAITRSAAVRQRSSRCSASRIVVSHSWLSRRSSPISSSPATGSSCEVGSSSSTIRGRPGERGAERDALLLAAGELVRGAVEQRVDAERERDLLDAARDRGGAVAAALERERELGAHGAHHELRLGILEQHARRRARAARARARACRARRACTRPAKRPPWKCGTSPQAARSSVDLPCPERPGEQAELARARSRG